MTELGPDDVATALDALDAYRYWELSDQRYRHDGFVDAPGSDDPDTAAKIATVDALYARLEQRVHAIDCDLDEDCTCAAAGDEPEQGRP